MARFGFGQTTGNPTLDILLQQDEMQAYPYGTNVTDQGPGITGTMGILSEAAGVGPTARRPRVPRGPQEAPPAAAGVPAAAPRQGAYDDPFALADEMDPIMAQPTGGESPGLMAQLGGNLSRNVGGLGGALMSAGGMFGHMAAAAARGGPGGVGNAVAEAFGQGVSALPQSFAQNRGRQDEINTRAFISDKLQDPNLPDDERRILEAYGTGDPRLATLQLQLERYRAAGGPKPLSREQKRLDDQRRSRWGQFAAGKTGDIFDPDMLGVEGSILNDSLKRFHGESDQEYSERLAYANWRGSLDAMEPEPFDQWRARMHGGADAGTDQANGSSEGEEAGSGFFGFLGGDSQGVTDRSRAGAPLDAPIDDLEASFLGDAGMAPQSGFSERVFGIDDAMAEKLGGGPIDYSGIPKMSTKPMVSTLRREAELLEQSMENYQGSDGYKAGVLGRANFMQGLSNLPGAISDVPGDFRRAWQNTRY